MSEVKVNKVTPRSGTTLTIGDSGDTTNVVGTLQNNGAALVGDISSVVAGTNLSGGGTSGAVTINLADASTSAKGASSFSSDNFAASSGAITIKTGGVATAELQEDAVTLAKMAPGTDGNIISYDGSGNPVAIATGSDGQVLTSAGTGAQPAFETLNVTPAANSITTSQLAYNPNAFRNIIINGDMNVSQRATSKSSITADGYYTVDRFLTEMASFGAWTQSQYADAPSGQGLNNSLKMDCTTAQGSLPSNIIALLGQSVEGRNLQAINQGTSSAKSTTLSFWHKHTKTGTNIVELLDADNGNAVSGAYTQSNSNTWEKATIVYPANTSGTYGNDSNRSLRIRFIMGAGSDTTSGTLATTWQTSITNANRYVGQVNNADSTSNNFIITGVQYEVATVASEFELLPFDINLQRCHRYYYLIASGSGVNINFIIYNTATNTASRVQLSTIMRANPSLDITTGTGYYRAYRGGNSDDISAFTLDSSRTNYIYFYDSSTSSGTIGYGGILNTNNSSSYIAASAEL